MSIIASRPSWKVEFLDVRTAFLQGQLLKRNTFLLPPKDVAAGGNLWKLNKGVYGLNDASRLWYERVKTELLALNCTISTLDQSLFFYKVDDILRGIIGIHVDDFWTCGTTSFFTSVVEKLSRTFTIGKRQGIRCRFLGLDIRHYLDGIHVSLSNYVDKLEEIHIEQSTQGKHRSTTIDEHAEMRRVLGQFQWLSNQASPMICFDVSSFLSIVPSSTLSDLIRLKKLIRKIKHSGGIELFFPNLGDIANWAIVTFSDASLANCADGSTQGGHIVFLCESIKNYASIISWQSRKLRHVVRSTLSAETMARIEGIDTGFLIFQLF